MLCTCRRLESLAAGDTFTYDTHRPTGLNNDRAFKQLQQVQSSVQSLEQQHAASCSSNKALTEQLHKMEERIQQLESQGRSLQQQGQQLQQQLGSPAQSRSILHGQHRPASSTYMSITSAGGMSTADDPAAGSAQAVGHGAAPGGRSMAARLSKLEQQVDNLTATASNTAVSCISLQHSPQQVGSMALTHSCKHSCNTGECTLPHYVASQVGDCQGRAVFWCVKA